MSQPNAVSLSVTALKDCPAPAIDEICALKMQHWPYPVDSQREWWCKNSDSDDRLVRLLAGAGLAAFLRLRHRFVLADGNRIDALCATEVCVTQALQHSGLGRRLMTATTEIIASEPQRIGYLLCKKEQQGFYAKCCWSQRNRAVRIRATNGEERSLASDELCFLFDPHGLVPGPLTVVGDTF